MRKRSLWIAGVGLAVGLGLLGIRSGAEYSVGQAPVTALRPQPAGGATQIFLRLVPSQGQPPVQGESVDKNHAGEIAVQSYSLSVKNPTTIGSATGGAGAGKVVFEQMEFVHTVDRSSPGLFRAMSRGAHFAEATLTVRVNGLEFERIRLGTVFITNITQGGQSGGLPPTETVRMVFGAMQEEYRGVSGKETGSASWNQITNTEKVDFPK